MINEEEWRQVRYRAAQRSYGQMEETPEGPDRDTHEFNMWMNLFFWAEPSLELQDDELDEAEASYEPAIPPM